MLLRLLDDIFSRELNVLDIKVLRFVDIWSVPEEFTSVDGHGAPTVLSDLVSLHDEKRLSLQVVLEASK
jgi:hypothetical protein